MIELLTKLVAFTYALQVILAILTFCLVWSIHTTLRAWFEEIAKQEEK